MKRAMKMAVGIGVLLVLVGPACICITVRTPCNLLMAGMDWIMDRVDDWVEA